MTVLLAILPVFLAIEYRIDLGAVSFMLSEAGAAVLVAAVLVYAARSARLVVERDELALIFLIAVFAFVSVFLERDKAHALSLYRDLMAPLVFFALLTSIRLERREVLALVKGFVLVAAATALLGLLQYATGKYLWVLRPEDVDWQAFKTSFIRSFFLGEWLRTGTTLPAGLYATTNNFASYLVIPCLVAYALGWAPRLQNGGRTLWRACFLVMLAALFLTFSRGSILTLLVAWVVIRAFRERHRITPMQMGLVGAAGTLVVAVIIVSGVFSFDELGTVRGRFIMISAGWELLIDHPELLIAGGFTEDYRTHYYAGQLVHNLELYMLIQYGLIVTVAWLLLVARQLGKTYGLLRSPDPDARAVALSVFAGVGVTVFVYAQTTSFVDNIQSAMWLFFWLGIAVHLYRVSGPAAYRVVWVGLTRATAGSAAT